MGKSDKDRKFHPYSTQLFIQDWGCWDDVDKTWHNGAKPVLRLHRKFINFSFMVIFRFYKINNLTKRLRPFEKGKNMAGQNTSHFLLLNDANMIGVHKERRIKMPNTCPFEKRHFLTWIWRRLRHIFEKNLLMAHSKHFKWRYLDPKNFKFHAVN